MVYLYRCVRCGMELEREYPIGTAPNGFFIEEVDGPMHEMRRVYTPPQLSFSGPDFYSTENSKSPLLRIPRKQRL